MALFNHLFFNKEFLHLKDDEFEFLLTEMFGENFMRLARETGKKVATGRHDFKGSTGEKLVQDIPNGMSVLEAIRKMFDRAIVETDKQEEGVFSLSSLLKESLCDGLSVRNVLLDARSEKLLSRLIELEQESQKLAMCIRDQDIQGIKNSQKNMKLGEDFWEGLDEKGLLNVMENRSLQAKLILKAYVYMLAILEHVFLSLFYGHTYQLNSQISFALLGTDNPYVEGNEKPLQRFFCTLFHDHSMESVIERIRKQVKSVTERDGYRRSFRKKLSSKHLFSFKEVGEILGMICEKYTSQSSEVYPVPMFWGLFIASRAFHRIWLAYEAEIESEPLWKEIFPNGPDELIVFYDQAYSDIAETSV